MSVHRAAGVLIVSLSTLMAACEDGTGPRINVGVATAPSVGTSPLVSLSPTTIAFSSIPGFGCPATAPFLSSFSLLIDQRSGSDIFLDHVVFQFGDRFGRRSPLELSRSELARMFGTTLVPGGATRAFAFRPQFGCGLLSLPSVLFIDLTTLNRAGVRHQGTLTATLE